MLIHSNLVTCVGEQPTKGKDTLECAIIMITLVCHGEGYIFSFCLSAVFTSNFFVLLFQRKSDTIKSSNYSKIVFISSFVFLLTSVRQQL